MKRVIIESSRYENDELLVTVRGLAGERFEDLPWTEPHGFHARPAPGASGWLEAPGGDPTRAHVMSAADPAKRKKVGQLGEGEAAMYDAGDNVVTLTATGWAFNMDVQITGKLTVSGDVAFGSNLEVAGDVDAGGSVVDGDGDGGA